MADVRILDPHDPLPAAPESFVLVLARFADDDPTRVVTEVTLHRRGGGDQHAVVRADSGEHVGFDDAIRRARALAAESDAGVVYVLDRTAGQLERYVIEHHGSHRFEGVALDDGAVPTDNVDVSGIRLQPDPEVERDLGHRRDIAAPDLDPER